MSENEEKTIQKEQHQEPVQNNNQTPSQKNGGLNALLFIGSFLIVVGSCSLFLTSAVSDMAKLVILLLITTVFYVAGFLIRQVKILIPAGTAFVCTSLAVMPFLGCAFSEYTNVSPEFSWLLTSIIGTIAYISASLIIKSRLIALGSVGFIISLFCSVPTNLHIATLWNYLSVISVSIIANLISLIFKEKVPSAYRDILSHVARWLSSAVAFATVFSIRSLYGFDYSIVFGICLIQLILSRLTTKSFVDEVLARCVFIPFFLSLFWNTFPAGSSEFTLLIGLVLISEVVYSFFASLLRPENLRGREIAFVVVAFFFSALCPTFVKSGANLTLSAGTIGIIIFSINVILSILFAVFWKKKGWLSASYVFSMLIPLCIDFGGEKSKLVLIIYVIELIIFSIYLYFQKTRSRALENFTLIFFSTLLFFSRFAISTGPSAELIVFNVLAYIIPAFDWLIFGLKSDNKNRIETSFYFFVAFLGITVIQNIEDSGISLSLILANMVLLSFGTASIYRKSYPRAIIATSIFIFLAINTTLALSSNGSSYCRDYTYSGGYYGNTVYTNPALSPTYKCVEPKINPYIVIPIIFLAEEIVLAVIGILKHKKAIFWVSASGIVISAFILLRGVTALWLILFGIAIIAFVIWRLLKSQQKPTEIPKESENNSSNREQSNAKLKEKTEDKSSAPVDEKESETPSKD